MTLEETCGVWTLGMEGNLTPLVRNGVDRVGVVSVISDASE